jgi:hypothetical protein
VHRLSISGDRLWSFGLFGLVLFACLALAGQLPGLTNSLPATIAQDGATQCLVNHGFSQWPVACPDVGYPLGEAFVQALPLNILGFLLTYLPGVSTHLAVTLSCMLVTAVGLAGATTLLRSIGIGFPVALGGAALYLLSPSVLTLVGFGSTYWAFLLLPTAALIDLDIFRRWPAVALRRRVAFGVGWFLVKLCLLFLDGYAFVMGMLVTIVIFGLWASQRVGWRTAGSALLAVLAATGAAYFCYERYIPGGGYAKSSIDLFRSMGLDVTSLVRPSTFIWWAKLTNHPLNTAALWGDGSNSVGNYVGLGCALLALLAIIACWRSNRGWVLGLLALGLIGLVMSLGPSLKVGATRPPLAAEVTYQSYLMPKQDGIIELPTTLLDEHAPGITQMRATYRWFLLTRWSLIALATLGVQELLVRSRRSKHPWPAVLAVGLLACLSVAELMPAPSARLHTFRAGENQRLAMERVATELKSALPARSLVAYVVGGVSPASDYLASFLTPRANLRSYNIGDDKGLLLSKAHWPASVSKVIQGPNVLATNVEPVLVNHLADAIIVPKFDLRWSAYSWPPALVYQQRGTVFADQLAAVPGLHVKAYQWFYVVTYRS